jgi:hypothetical protein
MIVSTGDWRVLAVGQHALVLDPPNYVTLPNLGALVELAKV